MEYERENPQLIRLWRVWRTTRQMLGDRGYQFTDEELELPLPQFKARFASEGGEPNRSAMGFSAGPTENMLRKYTDPPTARNPDPQPQIGTIWVEFTNDESVGLKQLRAFMHHLNANNYYTGIFICPRPVTSVGMRFLQSNPEFKPPGGVEVFNEQDLLVNITRHVLVPKHVLLSKEEKSQLLERYRLKETQLPRIQLDDPVARYLGLRRGQVVKIIRKSETAGRYASYRWCI